ncbi:MAG: hypothetical protein PHY94_03920 [Candidatus Omnitrophica bacterium]|nr:hypothetical protein [Candidatus Omnitrophota bacterium]
MGITHKLKPEIRDFILDAQKNNLKLSCRGIASLVFEKFQIQISKSSINTLIKNSGLSMPVGRRRVKPFTETPIKEVIKSAAQAVLSIQAPPEVPVLAPPQEPPVLLPEVKVEKPAEAAPEEAAKEKIISPEVAPEQPQEEEKITENVSQQPAATQELAPINIPPDVEEKPGETKPETPPEPLLPEVEEAPLPDEILPVTPAQSAESSPIEVETTGAVILKAADFLFGGTFYLSEIIKNRLISRPADTLAMLETLLYAQLYNLSFNQDVVPEHPLWSLTKKKFSSEVIKSFSNELDQMKVMNKELFSTIQKVFRQIRGIQATLADGSVFYFDGQLHCLWTKKDTPDYFSTTTCNIKIYINEELNKEGPYVLLQAQDTDIPTKELADFIFALEQGQNQLSDLTIYDNKLNSVDTIHPDPANKRFFVFGLWPWQFIQYRKINLLGEFKAFRLEALKKDFFIACAQIDLLLPGKASPVSLRGAALKSSLNEKIKLVIVTNLPTEKSNLEEIANIYLNRWPNPQESFETFSRKVELFTYTGNSEQAFAIEKLKFNQESISDIRLLLDYYLKGLDMYVRGNFLPAGYEGKDFPLTKEKFYDLKVTLKQEDKILRAIFHPGPEYANLKDLEFLCNRLNEREIKAQNGLKVWFCV